MIPVSDMKTSVRFYRTTLGLTVLYETDTWSELAFNNALTLALKKADANDIGGQHGLGFQVTNCERETRHLESQGADIYTRCQLKGTSIVTQIKDPDDCIIWLAEKRR